MSMIICTDLDKDVSGTTYVCVCTSILTRASDAGHFGDISSFAQITEDLHNNHRPEVVEQINIQVFFYITAKKRFFLYWTYCKNRPAVDI